ncbi:MAG: EAL and HDOD domain-containing protein [Betaproteobacteria bacterium]
MSEESPPSLNQLFLGRQPILDRDQQLVAYELLFRSSMQNFAEVTDAVAATATVIVNAFSELSITESLGDCRGFINVDEQFLFSDVLELLPTQSVVLEILETVPPTPEVARRCRELKEKGFTLALDDVIQVAPEYHDLLQLAEIIKVDIQPLSQLQLLQLTGKLKPLNKRLLAEKVDSRGQMEQCLKLGYQLFQGYYFAKPTIIAGRKLNHSQLSLMKLMSLLLSDADTGELEAAFKPEPGLTVSLLRMTNSVGAGTTVRITSLRHAITVLGRRQLQRWLQLLLFASGSKGGEVSPLLHLAATRGRLMELLAGVLSRKDPNFADEAFMAGIMSLMPALVGLDIRDIIAPLGIANEVRDALCDGTGPLGSLLGLVAATESGDPAEIVAKLRDCPGLDAQTLNRCLSQALAWASSIHRDSGT